jgi:hypothetical protein
VTSTHVVTLAITCLQLVVCWLPLPGPEIPTCWTWVFGSLFIHHQSAHSALPDTWCQCLAHFTYDASGTIVECASFTRPGVLWLGKVGLMLRGCNDCWVLLIRRVCWLLCVRDVCCRWWVHEYCCMFGVRRIFWFTIPHLNLPCFFSCDPFTCQAAVNYRVSRSGWQWIQHCTGLWQAMLTLASDDEVGIQKAAPVCGREISPVWVRFTGVLVSFCPAILHTRFRS